MVSQIPQVSILQMTAQVYRICFVQLYCKDMDKPQMIQESIGEGKGDQCRLILNKISTSTGTITVLNPYQQRVALDLSDQCLKQLGPRRASPQGEMRHTVLSK